MLLRNLHSSSVRQRFKTVQAMVIKQLGLYANYSMLYLSFNVTVFPRLDFTPILLPSSHHAVRQACQRGNSNRQFPELVALHPLVTWLVRIVLFERYLWIELRAIHANYH